VTVKATTTTPFPVGTRIKGVCPDDDELGRLQWRKADDDIDEPLSNSICVVVWLSHCTLKAGMGVSPCNAPCFEQFEGVVCGPGAGRLDRRSGEHGCRPALISARRAQRSLGRGSGDVASTVSSDSRTRRQHVTYCLIEHHLLSRGRVVTQKVRNCAAARYF
jgi:hypothetical protein